MIRQRERENLITSDTVVVFGYLPSWNLRQLSGIARGGPYRARPDQTFSLLFYQLQVAITYMLLLLRMFSLVLLYSTAIPNSPTDIFPSIALTTYCSKFGPVSEVLL